MKLKQTTIMTTALTIIMIMITTVVAGAAAGRPRWAPAATEPIRQSGTIPQPYTNVTFSDPALGGADTAAATGLLQALLHATVQGTGTPADGAPAVPHAEPPSLLVTRDVVEALVAMDGPVPAEDAERLAGWVWSRWHAAGGYFDDEYSMNWSTLEDGGAWLASNRYSPVVATGCALDVLSMLRQPVPAAANDSARAFLLSCHDPVAGTFKGRPGAVEPTLLDAAWALRALWLMGRLHSVDASACAAHVVSMNPSASGLYQLHVPSLVVPAPEYSGATVPATRLAVEALSLLGRFSPDEAAAARDAVMACYDAADHRFRQDPYSPQRNVRGTADALRVLSLAGMPAAMTPAELEAIASELSRKQLPGGGWALDDGEALACTSQAARAVTELLRVAGTTGTVDLAKVRGVFARSLACDPAEGLAAYCPYPADHPALPVAAGLVLLASRWGLLDGAAEAAALELVGAAGADGSGTYPRKYPDVPVLSYSPAGEFRTMGTGGIAVLAPLVALKDAVAVPFSLADLNALDLALDGIQYRGTSMLGLEGLCLTRHDVSPIHGLPCVPQRIASLEATHAAARLVDTLRGYGNGSWFVPSRFLDLGLLCQRLASGYRESGPVAWFEREYPASYQQPAGLDNARLRDTRLAVEVISMTGTFSHGAIAATVNPAKLANLALVEPRRTVADVDDAAAILAALNATTTVLQRVAMVQQVLSFKSAGSAWFRRAGLPSAPETLRAWSVLSRFSGIAAELSHVVAADGTGIQAIAGTSPTLAVR
ncbi:MAG: hypothetical protein JXB32_08350, partial [Deltaproteobacteria bacterium]|nr:hypothetical protein [Deltaproteobacteria bacterium]